MVLLAAALASAETSIAAAQAPEASDSAARAAAAKAAEILAGSPLPSRGANTVLISGEVGYRGFTSEPPRTALAKLVEYKAVPTGPVLLNFLLGYTARDSLTVFQLNGSNFGQRDQTVRLRGNSPGVYDLQVRWDRVPHTFSTNARSLGSEPSPGVYVLPTPRPDTGTWNRT